MAMGCNSNTTENKLTNSDIEKIHTLHENYRKYWIQNDSAKVIDLFSKNGGLFLHKIQEILSKGKRQLANGGFQLLMILHIQLQILFTIMIPCWLLIQKRPFMKVFQQ